MKRYPMVEIRWIDAVEVGGWVEHGDVRAKPMPSRTAGYLVAENRDGYTIAAIVNANHVGCAVTIPRRMVTSIRTLTPTGARSRRPERRTR